MTNIQKTLCYAHAAPKVHYAEQGVKPCGAVPEEGMEERKSMGSALVDVFDAGVVLVKSEINGVTKKVTEMAKAKGIGVVLLLGAVGPLLMGLIFLILFVFYGLMRLGLGAWAAALLIALFSFVVAGGLAMFGLQKLSAEVDTDQPRRPVNMNELTTGGAPVAAAAYPTQTYSAQSQAPVGSVSVAPVPVYESKADGEPQAYGSGLNKKVASHGHHHDPNLKSPVVMRDAPGITVSTDPTFREDMKKEGY